MHVSGWAWAVLLGATPVLLALDLFVLPRGHEAIGRRAAFWWSVVWTLVGLSFALLVAEQAGETYAVKYLTGFAVEKALAVDQALVFALVVTSFAAPARAATRTIFYALWIGLLLKVPFIALGSLVAHRLPISLHWITVGLFTIGGFVFLLRSHADPDAAQNRYLRWMRRRASFTDTWAGDRFVVRQVDRPAPPREGQRPASRHYTLAFAMLVALLTADIYFAATVPLAFATKKPAFLVLASSTLALLGIRALFWWVSTLDVDRTQLRIALASVLWLVAVELALEPVWHGISNLMPELVFAVIGWPLVSARRRQRPLMARPYPRPVDGEPAADPELDRGVERNVVPKLAPNVEPGGTEPGGAEPTDAPIEG